MEKKSNSHQVIKVILVLAFLIILIRNAWVSQTAYFLFRSIENFVQGYGLVFNPGERVLPISQPLWPIILGAVYSLTLNVFHYSTHSQLYFIVIFFSIAVTLITISLYTFRYSKHLLVVVTGFVVLMSSKAFVDYSTSGFENPLIHLLLILSFIGYEQMINSANEDGKWVIRLPVLISVTALLRWEAALLVLPLLGVVFAKSRNRVNINTKLAAFLPFLFFLLFTFLYYGVIVSNDLIARLHSDVGILRFIRQGGMYIFHSIDYDPVSILAIVFAGVGSFIIKDKKNTPILIGLAAYLMVVILEGGDSLGGRMLSPAVLGGVLLLSRFEMRPSQAWKMGIVVFIAFGIATPLSPITSGFDYENPDPDHRGIFDGRGLDYSRTGLLSIYRGSVNPPDSEWAGDDWHFDEYDSVMIVEWGKGFDAYRVGPNVYILPLSGIGDSLLARLPVEDKVTWDIHTLNRKVPDGYEETLLTGDNVIVCEPMAEFYESVLKITTGELFSRERIALLAREIDPFESAFVPPECLE